MVLGAGSDGIGGAVAARFAAEGYTTVVSRRKVEPLQAFVDKINASGRTAIAHPADARDEGMGSHGRGGTILYRETVC